MISRNVYFFSLMSNNRKDFDVSVLETNADVSSPLLRAPEYDTGNLSVKGPLFASSSNCCTLLPSKREEHWSEHVFASQENQRLPR